MHFLAAFIMWKIAEEDGDEDEEKNSNFIYKEFWKDSTSSILSFVALRK